MPQIFLKSIHRARQCPVPELSPEILAQAFGPPRAHGEMLTVKTAPEASLERRLLDRATMGWTRAAQDEIDSVGYGAWLRRQLDFEEIDDGPLEDALHETLPTLSMQPWELLEEYQTDRVVPALELLIATLYRAIYSPRQLFERMTIFWSDHFNIDLSSDLANFLKPIDDRDVIRRHALGKFPDLLAAGAHSPAMLVYLTNISNVAEHPNENYARELMELHTLGADGGFGQEDVREVARALTGWRIQENGGGNRFGTFVFDPDVHDFEAKTVLGHHIPAGGGVKDGEMVLRVLASHPSTARFISRKMLRYFWGYEPPERFVEKVAEVYLDTDGDIRAMLRTVLRRPWMEQATPKLKRPFHLMTSAVRALRGEIEDPFFLIEALQRAGHQPFGWQPPNGYPDHEVYWSPSLLPRWNFAATFLGGPVRPGVPELDPYFDPQRGSYRDSRLTSEQLRRQIDQTLTGGRLRVKTKVALRDFLAGREIDHRSIHDSVSLAVSSPEFQFY